MLELVQERAAEFGVAPDIEQMIPGKQRVGTVGSNLPMQQPKCANIFQIGVMQSEKRMTKWGQIKTAVATPLGYTARQEPETKRTNHVFADAKLYHRLDVIRNSMRVTIKQAECFGQPRIAAGEGFMT